MTRVYKMGWVFYIPSMTNLDETLYGLCLCHQCFIVSLNLGYEMCVFLT